VTPPETVVITDLEARLATIRGELATARGALEDVRTEFSRLESDAGVVQARIERDARLLNDTASAKDAVGIEHELASLHKRRDDLDDIQLSVMEQLEAHGQAMASIEAERDRLLGELDAAQTAREARLAELSRERERLLNDRLALTGTLPADLIDLYDRQRQRYGFGASLLQRGVSTASGVTLTGADLDLIRAAAADEVLLCPDSNAILIRTEESGI
jgi:hypothetical protein